MDGEVDNLLMLIMEKVNIYLQEKNIKLMEK